MSFTKPKIEIADLFREHRHRLHIKSGHLEKVIDAIVNCRTERLGGHIYQCDNSECGSEEQSYNSCRNRNCPKCSYSPQELWVDKRVMELLPIPYFHMVFTLPHSLNELIIYNKVKLYGALFKASQLAVKKLMKKNYKADPGMISLLHTWGSNLSYHVHAHMLLTGGGIGLVQDRWIPARENYSLPVKALSPIYRAEFIKEVRKLKKKGKLTLPPSLEAPFAFENLLDSTFSTDWVVYAKKPFTAPIEVLRYLGNYTHRIAFSNHRIVKVENDRVFFHYKEYKDGSHENKIMSLEITEFLRRFLIHVVPRRFVKIRFYGIMANKVRKKKIDQARELIAKDSRLKKLETEELKKIVEEYKATHTVDTDTCRVCKKGKMQKLKEIAATGSGVKFKRNRGS